MKNNLKNKKTFLIISILNGLLIAVLLIIATFILIKHSLTLILVNTFISALTSTVIIILIYLLKEIKTLLNFNLELENQDIKAVKALYINKEIQTLTINKRKYLVYNFIIDNMQTKLMYLDNYFLSKPIFNNDESYDLLINKNIITEYIA